jgi:hypothetical protein
VYSVRPRQLGVPTPPVTIARLRQGSEVIDLGGAVSVARSRARWDAGVYRFDVVGVRHRLVGEVSCLPAQQLDYPLALPGGRAAHAAQAGNADVHVTIHRRGLRGFSTSRLVATGTALLEVGLASRESPGAAQLPPRLRPAPTPAQNWRAARRAHAAHPE